MARIILIETSTALCSTAICEDGKVIAYKESEEPRAQAAMTVPFIEENLRVCGLKPSDCDAVCVSMGPGSYTGLRVGVSTAKGLCFGTGLPLLALGTLDILREQAVEEAALPQGCKFIVPMVDARRMEVYCATFSTSGERLSETQPTVVDSESFADILAQGPVLFVGDGAQKCRGTLISDNAYFHQCYPKASAMAVLAEQAFREKQFKDVAYFEPFYLKQFIATVSSKKLF